jgi:hypothetical protein
MYYIYHIPGVKIGCTSNLKKRIQSQGFTEYEVLETHTDIDIASNREIELQNEYGYVEPSRTNYKQHIEFGKAGQIACKGKPNKGAQTQIKDKIGIFGYSKEERLALNTKANFIRAKISAEKRSKPVIVYDYKTNKLIGEWKACKYAAVELKANNLRRTIEGDRKHSNGYYAKFK